MDRLVGADKDSGKRVKSGRFSILSIYKEFKEERTNGKSQIFMAGSLEGRPG